MIPLVGCVLSTLISCFHHNKHTLNYLKEAYILSHENPGIQSITVLLTQFTAQ